MMNMNEEFTELMTYLVELRKLSEGGYRCNTEIEEAVEKVREYLRLCEYENYSEVTYGTNPDNDKDRYYYELSKITGARFYRTMNHTNEVIYSAYKGEEDLSVYFEKFVGVTTSCKALANTFDDVVFISSETDKGLLGKEIEGKTVFVDVGEKLPVGLRPKRVIRIIQLEKADSFDTVPEGFTMYLAPNEDSK